MIIDVHAHYWPAALLDAAADGRDWFGWEPLRASSGPTYLALGDRLVRFPVPRTDLGDEADRSARRQQRGVDAEVIMPVGFLWNHHLSGRDAASYSRQINEEVAAAQSSRPGAYRGLAMLPFQAPDHFEAELQMASEMGLIAAALPASVRGRNLDDPTLLSMIERVADAGMAMLLHPTYLDPPGRDRFPRYYFVNSVGASLECTVGLMSLIHSGLFDRRDDVRVVVVQAGGSIPYEIGRFSLRYAEREDVRTMQQSPEKYLSRVYYDCMVADSDSLELLVHRVGADRIMIGTDHPFRSDVQIGAVRWIGENRLLGDDDKAAILSSTASHVFGFVGA